MRLMSTAAHTNVARFLIIILWLRNQVYHLNDQISDLPLVRNKSQHYFVRKTF